MNGPMPHHERTTGHQVWLVIAVTLGLAVGAQATAAKECHHETPLPADVRLLTPGPEIPAAVAPFAGVWVGVWEDSGELCHTLVVEEVFANGYARVIYSVGTSQVLNIRLPGFRRATAKGRVRLCIGRCLGRCASRMTGGSTVPVNHTPRGRLVP
jgi:hypothetical protein